MKLTKLQRKELIIKKKLGIKETSPNIYLSVLEEDKANNTTPNRKKYDYYMSLSNRAYDIRIRAGLGEKKYKNIQRILNHYDALAAQYCSVAFLEY